MGNKIKQALISVTDKKGMWSCEGPEGLRSRVLSTGGTAAQIKAAGST